jgi:hypothetical protein
MEEILQGPPDSLKWEITYKSSDSIVNRDSLFSSADEGNANNGYRLITLADKAGEPGVLLVSVIIL